MIQLPANATIFVMYEPISFRTRIDGTCAVARVVLQKEPMDGAYFVFRNKRGHMMRILYYDGGGFWLCEKRLSQGTFSNVWPQKNGDQLCANLMAREIQILIWAGNPASCNFPQLWRRVA